MNDLQHANYLTQIHQLLVANFDEEELKTLCPSLGLTYDDLPASGRVNKARELVTYLARRGRLPDLRTAVAAARPNAIWPGATGESAGVLQSRLAHQGRSGRPAWSGERSHRHRRGLRLSGGVG